MLQVECSKKVKSGATANTLHLVAEDDGHLLYSSKGESEIRRMTTIAIKPADWEAALNDPAQSLKVYLSTRMSDASLKPASDQAAATADILARPWELTGLVFKADRTRNWITKDIRAADCKGLRIEADTVCVKRSGMSLFAQAIIPTGASKGFPLYLTPSSAIKDVKDFRPGGSEIAGSVCMSLWKYLSAARLTGQDFVTEYGTVLRKGLMPSRSWSQGG